MDVSAILALIDEELVRLQSARAILATLGPVPSAEEDIAQTRTPKRGLDVLAAEILPELSQLAAESVQPAPDANKPRRRSSQPGRRVKTVASAAPGPLQKPLSARPVFVPAGRVPARHTAHSPQPLSPRAPETLTAEALSHRWLPPAAL